MAMEYSIHIRYVRFVYETNIASILYMYWLLVESI
jgi:hypothetical protein